VYGNSSQCAQIYKSVRLCDTASGLAERLAGLSERHPILDRLCHLLIRFDLRLYKGKCLFEHVDWADYDAVEVRHEYVAGRDCHILIFRSKLHRGVDGDYLD